MSEPLALELPAELVEAIAQRVAEILDERHDNHSPWMTRPEAAAYMGLPQSRLEKDRGIPCHREGRRVLYHAAELDTYLSSKLDTKTIPSRFMDVQQTRREETMTKRDLERVAKAAEASKKARERRDEAIRAAHPQHSVREIAKVAGLSHARVGQIVRGEER